MKRILFSLSALAFAALNVAAQGKTHVTIVNKGLTDSPKTVLKIGRVKERKTLLTDTVEWKDGRASIEADLQDVSSLYLIDPADQQYLRMAYVVPGKNLTLRCTEDSTIYEGAPIYDDMTKADNLSIPFDKRFSEISDKVQAAGEKRDSIITVLRPEIEKIENEKKQVTLDFVKANPDNEANVLLAYGAGEADDMATILNMLPEKVKKGTFAAFCDIMDKYIQREKARKEASKLVADGCDAPDFTLKDPDGKELSLSSLKGKYVVLDFWGSWCIWCIRGIPNMKKMYEKYKPTGKLEILSVDCNDTDSAWREALKKHDMPWLHVYNPKDSKLTTQYAIQGFPTKVIVGPDGKIVKTVVGEDPAFYDFIDSLFK